MPSLHSDHQLVSGIMPHSCPSASWSPQENAMTVGELLQRQAFSLPSSTPLIRCRNPVRPRHEDDEALTYTESFAAALLIANRLKTLYGLQLGQVVAFYSENSPCLLITILAIWLADGIVTALPMGSPTDQIAAMVRLTRPRLLIVSNAPEATSAVSLVIDGPDSPQPIDEPPLVITLSQLFGWEDKNAGWVDAPIDFIQALAQTREAENLVQDKYQPGRAVENDALYLFTSSAVSASSIKCARHTHRNLTVGSMYVAQTLGILGSPQTYLGWGPLSHAMGLWDCFIAGCICTGGTYCFAVLPSHRDDPDCRTAGMDRYLLEAANRYKPTCVNCPPALISSWMKMGPKAVTALSILKKVIIGGAPPFKEHYNWCMENRINMVQAPGSTETCLALCGRPVPTLGEGSYADGVWPREDFEVTLDSDGELDESVAQGELVISSRNIFRGYLGKESSKGEVTVFKTGDIYRRNPDGSLSYVMRKDDIIHLMNGEKVPALDWERRLEVQPGVARACVVGNRMPSDAKGFTGTPPSDFIIAIIELDEALPNAERQLVAIQAVQRINLSFAPVARVQTNHILVLGPGERLPITRKNTLFRKRVWISWKERLDVFASAPSQQAPQPVSPTPGGGVQGQHSHTAATTPDTSSSKERRRDVEEQVVEIVTDLFQYPVVGVDPISLKFDELGMDSIRARALVSRVNGAFAINMHVTAIYGIMDVQALIDHILERSMAIEHTLPDSPNPTTNGFSSHDLAASAPDIRLPGPSHSEDGVVFVGMSCRFPGGIRTPEEYWQALMGINESEIFMDIPNGRWASSVLKNIPGRSQLPRAGWFDDRTIISATD